MMVQRLLWRNQSKPFKRSPLVKPFFAGLKNVIDMDVLIIESGIEGNIN